MSQSGLWIPKTLKPAVKRTKIVFWYNKKMDRIVVGCPENWPAPKGFQKIVCESAHEVEKWSQKLRDQDKRDAEMKDAEREAIEGPIRDYARKELIYLRDHAKDEINRQFCQWSLDQIEERDRAAKLMGQRESYMHVEAAEDGH